MVKPALDIIIKIADQLEKEWDDKINDITKNGGVLTLGICNANIDSGVFDELKKRYDKAGWDLSIPPKENRVVSDPYSSYPVSFNMKRLR